MWSLPFKATDFRITTMGGEYKAMTIYEALKAKLGREPTHRELIEDVRRILTEATIAVAEQGKLRHQRRRP